MACSPSSLSHSHFVCSTASTLPFFTFHFQPQIDERTSQLNLIMLNLKSFTVASAALTLFSSVNAGLYPVKRNEEPAQPSCTDFTPFKYAGCFVDNGSPRTLLYTGPRNQNQTVQDCVAFCKGKIQPTVHVHSSILTPIRERLSVCRT